jgi:glucose-6-phosphate 1-epimerase
VGPPITGHAEAWRDLPCWRVTLPQGDSLLVAEQGAQVLSWTTGGRERLFLSPDSAADGRTPIRGGVPLCWPQFNQRGGLPKHGFARNLNWQCGEVQALDDGVEWRWHLLADAHTRALWPHAFELCLTLRLRPGQLRIALDIHNPGVTDWAFSGALHSYLAVDDVDQARLLGLGGQVEWDSLLDVTGPAPAVLAFAGAFDRVYTAAPGPLRLLDGAHAIDITQSPGWGHTVVWNPGGPMPDLPGEAHRRMLCVEAAQVLQPVAVAAGGRWHGWQQFDVAAG